MQKLTYKKNKIIYKQIKEIIKYLSWSGHFLKKQLIFYLFY